MVAISVPVPPSPIGTVDPDTGQIIMAREWYRFFGLLQQGVGGDTNFLDQTFLQLSPEQLIGEVFLLLANAALDAGGLASQAMAMVADQQARITALEAQVIGRGEPSAADMPLAARDESPSADTPLTASDEFPVRVFDDLQLLQRPSA